MCLCGQGPCQSTAARLNGALSTARLCCHTSPACAPLPQTLMSLGLPSQNSCTAGGLSHSPFTPAPSRERLHWEIRSSQQEGTPFPTTRHLPPSVPSPLAYGGRALPPLVPWTPPPGDQTPLSCVVIFSHSVGSRPSLNSPALALPAFASAPPFPAAFPARTS